MRKIAQIEAGPSMKEPSSWRGNSEQLGGAIQPTPSTSGLLKGIESKFGWLR